jgi:hypothetical protein
MIRTFRVVVVLAALGAWCSNSPAIAVDAKAIERAIQRGVDYLKSTNSYQSDALVGLTLLECGVSADDPVLVKLADRVRGRAVDETQTYHVSLAIMFLDRLGDPCDVPLLEALVIRLLAGQFEEGGWSYNCPKQDADELRKLKTLVEQRNELTAQMELPGAKTPRAKYRQMDNEMVKKQVAQLRNEGEPGRPGGKPPRKAVLGAGDNSNTQFAAMALWVARRSDLPIDEAAGRLDTRFRSSQCRDGGWGYTSIAGGHGVGTPSMTCAGLLGLAVARGTSLALLEAGKIPEAKSRAAAKKPVDPVIEKGLLALGTTVGKEANANNLYYLWSLERVGMAYGLKTIGKKDWYAWGAQALVATQKPDGSWAGGWGGNDVGTCFALLFLKRANLVHDLTAMLAGKVEDPGEVTLRGGGVGFEDLQRIQLGRDRTPEEIQADAQARAQAENRDKLEPQPPPSEPVKPSPEDQEREAERLAEALVKAAPDQQTQLIESYRDTKGGQYTQALAKSIPKATPDVRARIRDALAQRLTRMTPNTLRNFLEDEDVEIRFAAVLACGMKKNREMIPDLIKVLEDEERVVWRAAALSLEMLSGKSFGPDQNADLAARKKAAEEWSAWWNKNSFGDHRDDDVKKRMQRHAELVRKYSKMTAADLRILLVDKDVQIRAAAAEVAGTKRDRSLIPFLIPLIDHEDAAVAHHAYVALKRITNKDFGPDVPNPTDEQKADAKKRWENWYKLTMPNLGQPQPQPMPMIGK